MSKQIEGKHTDKTEVLKDKGWVMHRFVYYVYAKQMQEDFALDTVDGMQFGKRGDWMVMDRSGNRRLVSGSYFDTVYEKV